MPACSSEHTNYMYRGRTADLPAVPSGPTGHVYVVDCLPDEYVVSQLYTLRELHNYNYISLYTHVYVQTLTLHHAINY